MSGVRIVRVDLDRELSGDLDLIREFLGLKNDSEVIRYLIREKVRQIKHVTGVTTTGAE